MARKTITLLWYGILAHIIWTATAFIGYTFFGPGDQPTLAGSIVASILIVVVMYFITRWFNRKRKINPSALGVSGALFTLVLNILITIPNKTTDVFYTHWSIYLTFIAVLIGSWLGARGNIGDNKLQ